MIRTITARSVLELVAKVYKTEGWEHCAGEVKTRRVADVYEVRADHIRNRWVATRRDIRPA